MNKPAFQVGDEWQLAAIQVRVIAGRHGNGDMVLQLRTPNGDWAKMPMDLGALQTDFYDQNERKRYRWNGDHAGSAMYANMLNTAVFDGWKAAVERWLDPFRKAARPTR